MFEVSSLCFCISVTADACVCDRNYGCVCNYDYIEGKDWQAEVDSWCDEKKFELFTIVKPIFYLNTETQGGELISTTDYKPFVPEITVEDEDEAMVE